MLISCTVVFRYHLIVEKCCHHLLLVVPCLWWPDALKGDDRLPFFVKSKFHFFNEVFAFCRNQRLCAESGFCFLFSILLQTLHFFLTSVSRYLLARLSKMLRHDELLMINSDFSSFFLFPVAFCAFTVLENLLSISESL